MKKRRKTKRRPTAPKQAKYYVAVKKRAPPAAALSGALDIMLDLRAELEDWYLSEHGSPLQHTARHERIGKITLILGEAVDAIRPYLQIVEQLPKTPVSFEQKVIYSKWRRNRDPSRTVRLHNAVVMLRAVAANASRPEWLRLAERLDGTIIPSIYRNH